MTTEQLDTRKDKRSVILAFFCSGVAIAFLVYFLLNATQSREDSAEIIRIAESHISVVHPDSVDDRTEELTSWVLNTLHEAVSEGAAEKRDNLLDPIMDATVRDLRLADQVLDMGLENVPEGFHEVEVLSQNAFRSKDVIHTSVQWRVVGLVYGAAHRHRLGNTFSGQIELSWSNSQWRVTDLQIESIDRSDAGLIIDANR